MKLSRTIRFSLSVGCTLYFTMTAMVGANPEGAQVAVGGATFDTAGSALNITTATDRTVIDWQSFSISNGQITNFIQPNACSAVLNRVIGNMPSEIAGQLVSNARVGLINPNGILITASGSINTNGFFASSLDLSNEQFMGNGGLTFKGDSEAVVSNSGTILARQGDVFLIGRTVSNSGSIETRDGNVALAAGSEVTLQKAGDGRMTVTVPANSKKGTVSQSGTIKAVQQQLRDNGGNPYVLGMNVDSNAEMSPQDFMNAQVAINAGKGKATVSGTITAGTQAKGGEVTIQADEVEVTSTASVDVSGDTAGGSIKIGGGFQGKDATLTNAQTTWVQPGADLTADARVAGNGGTVIVWSDKATAFGGAISAKGGSLSGNGGFAEVSGKQWLSFQGTANTLAAHGNAGTLLLDPADITISAAPDLDITAAPPFGDLTNNGGTSNLNVATLTAALAGSTVAVNTTTFAGAAPFGGRITVSAPITWASARTLSLNADSNVEINAAVTSTGGGNFEVNANGGGISFGAAVTITGGGALSAVAVGGDITQTAPIAVTGSSLFNTGLSNSVLTNPGNDFGGVVMLSGTNVDIVDLDDLTLGSLNLSGNLTATSTGALNLGGGTVGGALLATSNGFDISQTGPLTVIGTSNANAGAGGINLASANNFVGAVTLTATGPAVSIRDTNALSIAGMTLGTGTLGINAVGITQTGAITQAAGAGAVTITGNAGAVTLDNAGNDFTGALTVTNSGANNVAIRDMNALSIGGMTLGTGTLGINAVGITQTGAITQGAGAGAVTITGNAGGVTLDDVLNDFTGAVTVTNSGANNVFIQDANALEIGGLTIGTGTLGINAVGITQSGAIVQTAGAGAVTITGNAGAVTLDNAGNDFTGALTVTNSGANNVAVRDMNVLSIGGMTLGTGTLGINAVGIAQSGAIVQTAGAGAVTITGNAGGISLTDAGNDFTGVVAVTNSGANNVTLVDLDSIALAGSTIGQALDVTAVAGISLSGSITSGTSQTYNHAVTLTGNATLTGSALSLAAGLTGGGNDLTLDFTTPVTLPGSITGVDNFIAQKAVNVNGSFTTSGSQTYNGLVTLTGDSTLTGTTLVLSAGLAGGGNDLTLDFTTPFTLTGAIAGVDNFTAQKAVNVNGSFTTTGTQTYNGGVTLTGNSVLTGSSLALASGITGGGNDLTLDFTSAVTLPASITGVHDFVAQKAVNVNGSFTTTGSQTYNAAVTLTGASTLTGTTLTLGSGLLGGGNDLTLDFTSPVALSSAIAGVDDFIAERAVLISGAFTTTRTQRYKQGVETVVAGGSLTGTDIRFDGKVSVGGDATAGALTITGNVEFSATSTLYVTLNGTAAGTFDKITVLGAGNTVQVTNATLDGEAPFSYSVGNSVTVIDKPVGAVIGTFSAGSSLAIDGQMFNIGYADGATGNIALTRAATTWTWDGGGGSDNWSDTVNWIGNAGVPGTGDIVEFAGALRLTPNNNIVGLALERIDFKTGASAFTLGGNAISLNTGIVNNSNNLQTVNMPLTLTADQAFNTTGSGALTIGGTITGAFDLTLSGTNVITLGGVTNLDTLTANSPAGISASTVTTTAAGGMAFNGSLAITGNTALNAGTAPVLFAGTVNGPSSLGVITAGTVTFGGAVGGGTPLAGLNVSAGSILLNGGAVTTNGVTGQVYTGPVVLGAVTVLNAGVGPITFGGTLDGGFALTANSSGATTFGAAVGGSTRLASILTDATGSVAFNGGSVKTTGAQDYQDAVSTGALLALDSGTGAITATNVLNDFAHTVSLTGGVVQLTDSNALTLGTVATGNLTVISTGALGLGTGTVSGILIATSNGGPISQSAGGLTVTGASTINAGAGTITLTDTNNDFQGAVSLTGAASQITDKNALRFGTGNVASLAVIAGGTVDQTGALTVTGATTLEVTTPGTDILLHTEANDFGGGVSVVGTQGNVRDFGLRNVNAGATVPTLSGLSGLRNLFITFNNAAVDLPALSASGNATVLAGGAITNSGIVGVGGLADLTGTSINIGTANAFNAGTLTFNSVGAVTISEGSQMNIVGVNTANSADLTATGALSDAGATSVIVIGLGSFNGTSIALGGGIFNVGTLTFNSAGSVVIIEDSNLDIVGINTAGSAQINATGTLSDAGATSVTVAGLGSFGCTSISLGGGIFNAGTLTFNTAGPVTIAEDSSMDIVGINTGGTTILTSTGAISDAGATSVNVGDLTVNGTSIALGAGVFNATTVNFNSAGGVTIAEDSDTDIVGINTADSASITSTGALSDAGATSVTVTGLGSFGGASISLGGGTFNTGTLTFNSAGNVTIAEDSNTDIVGVNTAGSALITSTGVLSDAGATSVTVTGLGSFGGTSISLGGGTFNTGTLTFNSAGSVTIDEDSNMDIVGINTGGTTTLTSTGGISDAGATSVNVGALTLNGTSVSLGGGIFNATTVNFNSAGNVTIAEDSNTDMVGVNTAGSALITSTGTLSDAGATSVTVTGLGSFGGTSISLGGGIFNTGTLTFNSAGSVTIDEDSNMDIVGVNTGGATTLTSIAGISDAGATSVNVGALTVNGTSIALGGGIFNATTVNFNSAGSVTIAEDSNTDIVGINTADSASITSTGALSDAGATSVTVTGLGSFGGSSISLGGGTFNTGTLTFNSAGSVTIAEDSPMDIVGINTGGTTILTSTGAISDAGATSVNVGALTVNGTSIALGGGIFNATTANFNSAGGVTIAEDSDTDIVGINTADSASITSTGALSDAGATSVTVAGLGSFGGASISLGGGTFNTGTLTFNSAGSVTIAEDSNTDIVGVNTAGSALITSTGALSDAGATSVTVTGLGSFGGTSISLGGGTFNTGTLTFNSAGSVTIDEDSNMDIVGVNTGGATTLTSIGGISDAGATSVNVGALTASGTSISLGGGIFNATTVNFNSAGNVTIAEDSNTDIVGVNTAGSALLTSTGALSDAGAASVTVTGLGSFGGASIFLGGGTFNTGTLTFNSAGNVSIAEDSNMDIVGVNTGGATTLTSIGGISDAGATSVNVGALTASGTSIALGGGIFNATTVNFNSAGNVTIAEDSDTDIVGINTAGSALITSTGALSDAGATSVTVTGLGSFGGASISLGGGTFNTGTLTFNSAGNVTIAEDSNTDIVGINTAGGALITSTGTLSDAGATSVAIAALGSFAGTSISLGGGTFNTGTLTFNSAGSVTIAEDSNMDIVGINTGGTTTLSSTGGISDAGATSVNVGALTASGTSIALGGGIFNATTVNFNSAGNVTIAEDSNTDIVGVNTAGSASITSTGALSDAGATSVTVTGLGSFGGTSISLGGGTFNTGTLTFNSAGNVTIAEDSNMDIVGANTAGSATLTSTGAISDAAATSIAITGLGSFAGTSISLGGGTFNTGTLTFNSAGSVNIAEDSNTDIVGVNTAGSALITSTGALSDAGATSVTVTGLGSFGGTSILLGGGIFNTGTLTFNSAGNVTIAEDSATALAGTSTAGSLALTSTGAVSDTTGTSLTVTNGSSIVAVGSSIVLNDTAGDVLTVGANASFTGTTITIGAAGTANFGTLTVNGTGAVDVQEDSDMVLAGSSTGSSLALNATGSIGDSAATTVVVTNGATVTATGAITLADNAGDILTVGANAAFKGTSVSVGTAGAANFGSLNFDSAGTVVVRESSATQLVGTNKSGALRLQSAAGAVGNIALAGSGDPGGPASIVATGDASLLASGGLTFGDGSTVTTTGTLDAEASSGNLTMLGSSTAVVTQSARIAASGDVVLNTVTAGGTVRVKAGGNIVDGQSDTVGRASNGFATLIGTRVANITATGAYLEAGGRIGATDDNPIDVSVASLATKSGGDTGVLVTSDVTLQQVSTTVQRIGLDGLPAALAESSSLTLAGDSATGDVRVETVNGNLTVALGISAGSNPGVTSSDALLLANGTGKALAINAGVTADDDVGLRAMGNVTAGAIAIQSTGATAPGPNGGTIDIESFGGNVNLGAGSSVSTANGNIRIAAESAGGSVTIANLSAPNLVALISDADLTGGPVSGNGLYAESKSGNINLTTTVTELAARANGNITITETNALSIGLTGGPGKVDRVALDNSEAEVTSLVSLGAGVGLEAVTGNLALTTGGTLSQTADVKVAGQATLNTGATGDINLPRGNSFNLLTVANARNVAIRDTDGGAADGDNQGLTLTGSNNFTGSAFVVATDGGMRFVPVVTKFTGPLGSKVVLIGGETKGLPGVNEVSGNRQPDEAIGVVNLDPDLDVVGSDIFFIANSLQSTSAPAGSYIRLIHGVPADPIRNLRFNYTFAAGGVNGILTDSVDGGAFGGAASLGALSGLTGDTAAFFSSAPFIDLAISDAAELARNMLKKGVAKTDLMGKVNSLIDSGAVAAPGVSLVYFGPYWTIGYDYDQYVGKQGEVPPPLFPLYYYFDADGKPVYLLTQPVSPDPVPPALPEPPPPPAGAPAVPTQPATP